MMNEMGEYGSPADDVKKILGILENLTRNLKDDSIRLDEMINKNEAVMLKHNEMISGEDIFLKEDFDSGLDWLREEFADKIDDVITLLNKSSVELEKNLSAKIDNYQMRYDILNRENLNKFERTINENYHSKAVRLHKEQMEKVSIMEKRIKLLTILMIVSVVFGIVNYIYH